MSNRKGSSIAAGGGKGKGKLMDDVKEQTYREPLDGGEKVKFPGAIKKNSYVLAVERDNKTWKLAQIMEIRVQTFDSDVEKSAYDRDKENE
jgi:hypothetical protein